VSANYPCPCPVRIRAGFTLSPCESPYNCVARCASSRLFRPVALRLPPMTMLASPEDRQAIKDSRGKCRSRVVAALRTFPGQFKYWDTIGSRRERGREVSKDNLWTRPFARTEHGQAADAVAVTPRNGHGLTVVADIGAAICPDRLRLRRVHCADSKTSQPGGVRRACHKPVGCSRANASPLRIR
jgi:hypothetical protein